MRHRLRGIREIGRGTKSIVGATTSISDLDAYFDAVWLPENSLDSGAGSISDGEVADTLVDSQGLIANLPYTGATGQRTGFSGPTYHDDGGNLKYWWFPNLQDVRWDLTGSISPTYAAPETVLIVLRRLPSWSGESVMKGGGCFNIKDNGTLPTADGYQFDLNTAKVGTTTGGWGGVNKIASLLVQFDSGNEEFYLNGTDIYNTGTITNSDWNDLTIGTSTNLMGCQVFGIWIKKEANFTAQQKSDIDDIIADIWTRNVEPSAYASTSTLSIETDGSGASRRFYLSLDNGTSEWTPPGGTTFQWHEAGSASARSFSNQNHISGATSADMDRADYTGIFTSHPTASNVWLTCEVQLSGVGTVLVPNHIRDNID